MNELGKMIFDARKLKGESLRVTAAACKISHNYLADIEQGKRFGSLKVLRRIAKHFDLAPRDLSVVLEEMRKRKAENAIDRLN